MNTMKISVGFAAAGKIKNKKMLPGEELLLLSMWMICAEKKREEEEKGLHRRRQDPADFPRRCRRFARVAEASAAGVGGEATAMMELC